ncbi:MULTISPECIES: helix-turn-helix domain-containing protein [unclassified Streptomyces]|uniref:winged helix-turn-helix transcriptional regulator n=1 Tax=unclassified Streptomyces TaxID=2593676 RepID=UPI002E14EFCB|nr:helix-turn-helix transcriptional regulator [Streptomyces sp. NBC_01197]WSS53136.1 helix-turn-helix transcriptional regulator [Streptomyces sp. NBC_01180]
MTTRPPLPMTQELFALLGERWNYAILREVFYGVERFGALQRSLGIAPNTLTARLAVLIDLELLERHRYREDKDWYDYRLTDSAREIVPAWVTLSQWAANHLRANPTTRRRLRHTGCGELTNPHLTCGHCGAALQGRDLEPVELPLEDEGPSGSTAATEPST